MAQIRTHRSFRISPLAILSLVFLCSLNGWAKGDLMSVQEAQEFCSTVWLPRMRIGHIPTDAEVKKSVAKLMELYTDNIEIIDPNSQDMVKSDSLKGKGQVSQYYEAILKNYPVWNINILEIYPNSKGFVLRYEGRNAGPVQRFEGVDILELKQLAGKWKISKIMEYYDRLPFAEKQDK